MADLEASIWVLHAFDVARAIELSECTSVTTQEVVSPRKREWPHLFGLKQRPLVWPLDPVSVSLPERTVELRPRAVIYDFGHVSIELRADARGPIDAWRDLAFALSESDELDAVVFGIVDQVLAQIAGALRDARPLADAERYLVYHVEAVPGVDASAWIDANAAAVAQALRIETETLSPREVAEAISRRVDYACDDVVVLDVESALVVDRDPAEALAVLDFANCERLALRVLDEDLDDAVQDASSMRRSRRRRWKLFFAPWGSEVRRLTQLTFDAAAELESVENAIKLTGDHYLARVYRLAVERFHLRPFYEGIARKLNTLWSIQKIFTEEASTRRLEALEWIIIALIAFEVVKALA
ncbi:MAG: hypothetical protein K8M05_23755 [Deltaproteobacteria bacterium]|nr:hypothetical protein [Kofleriaceae bacterium]